MTKNETLAKKEEEYILSYISYIPNYFSGFEKEDLARCFSNIAINKTIDFLQKSFKNGMTVNQQIDYLNKLKNRIKN